MADVIGQQFGNKPLHAHAYGNSFQESYYATKAANIADKVYLGIIPAGTEVSLFALINGANAASVTVKIGYEPVVAADGPAAVDDYWFAAGKAITAAGVTLSPAQPIRFDRDVKIVMTIAGAALTAVKNSVVASGKCIGVK